MALAKYLSVSNCREAECVRGDLSLGRDLAREPTEDVYQSTPIDPPHNSRSVTPIAASRRSVRVVFRSAFALSIVPFSSQKPMLPLPVKDLA